MTTFSLAQMNVELSIHAAGGLITFCVYVSLGFKQIVSEEEKEQMKIQEPLSSNLNLEDIKTKL